MKELEMLKLDGNSDTTLRKKYSKEFLHVGFLYASPIIYKDFDSVK